MEDDETPDNDQPEQNETESGTETGTGSDIIPEPETNETGTSPEINATEPSPDINETEPIDEINVTEPETNQTEQNSNETDNTNNQTVPIDTRQCSKDVDCVASQPCIEGSCLNGTCQYQSIAPCCGNSECEDDAGESHDSCPDDCDEPIPPIVPVPVELPSFSISLHAPTKVTRGNTVEFYATIKNTGLGTAFNVDPKWIMPVGLDLIATDNDCDALLPGNFCTITGQIYVQPELIGRKELRILVDYE